MCRLDLVKLWWAVSPDDTEVRLLHSFSSSHSLSVNHFLSHSSCPSCFLHHTYEIHRQFLACYGCILGIPWSSISHPFSVYLPCSFETCLCVSFTLVCGEHKVEGDVCRMSSGSSPLLPLCPGLFTTSHWSEAPKAPHWNLHTQPDTLNTQFIFNTPS